MIRVCCFFLLFILLSEVSAQSILIQDFTVKENLSKNGKLAVIAIDSSGRAEDHIRGNFVFSVNGFQQTLVFQDGVAVMQDPVESSTFVFFKHKNQASEVGNFYFIRKSDAGVKPYKISGFTLILLPMVVLLIAYVFKRLLVVFIVLAVLFIYLHVSKGLDISQLFDSFFFSLRKFL